MSTTAGTLTRRARRALTALLVLLGLAPGGHSVAAAEECLSDPRRRQLDFWVGEWRVVGEDGRLHGTHSVRKSDKGCTIEERWESPRGETGRSLSYFDPSAGRWRQERVDDRGRVARYEGELRDGAMHFLGTRIEADGSARRARLVLTPRTGPAVHQRVELAGEPEASWSLHFEADWVPVDQPPPAIRETETAARAPEEAAGGAAGGGPDSATPAEAAPAAPPDAASERVAGPEPAAVPVPAAPAAVALAMGHGSVRPQTGMASSEALAQAGAQIPMASPMVLRFPVGPIDRLSPGYAWTNREVARYECGGTTLEAIRITKGRPAKGLQPVEVTARLASTRRVARVELEVALLADDERVAEATLGGAFVGLGLPAQIQHGAVEHTLVLELEKGRLGELFADGRRPELEVTLRELGKGD